MLQKRLPALVLASALLGLTVPAQADSPFHFGYSPSFAAFTINDPDGPTDAYHGITYLSGLVTVDMGRDSRLYFNVSYDSFSVPASTTNIGQDVTDLLITGVYQLQFRATRGWKPWVGLGVGYGSEKYANRFLISPAGFLQTTYPDRSLDDFLVVINTNTQWQLSKSWDMGVNLELDQPISTDGMRSIRLGLYFLY
jgi:hypothetical protein